MKNLFTCLLLSVTQIGNAQITDSSKVLFANEWQFSANPLRFAANCWFGNDTVILYQVPRFDTANLLPKRDCMFEQRGDYRYWYDCNTRNPVYRDGKDGDRLWFDKDRHAHYANGLTCTIGETLRRLTELKMENGMIFVAYEKYPWNNSKEITSYTAWYKVVAFSPQKIILHKIKNK